MMIEPQSGLSATQSGTEVCDDDGVPVPSVAEAVTGTSGVGGAELAGHAVGAVLGDQAAGRAQREELVRRIESDQMP